MKQGSEKHIEAFEQLANNIMEAYQAAGMAVSVFNRKNVLYEKYFGWRDEENKLPINGDTIFGLASISKSFTCLGLMQLVEQGKIDLDGLVSTYIPEFKGKNQKDVRVRHLLSHSAGFYPEKRILARDVAMELGIMDSVEDLTYSDALAQKGIELVASRLDGRTSHIGRPGEYMSYSNDSFGLITDIVRRHGGEDSFSAYINKHILEPLQMERSSMEFKNPAKDENCSNLYVLKDGKRVFSKDFYDNAFVLMGGGAMKSTLNDMRRYVQMYLNEGAVPEGQDLLGSYYIREMCKPRQLYRYQQYYGYGLAVKFMEDLTVIGHGGSLPGVSSTFLFSPEADMGILVLCNTSDVPAAVVGDAILRAMTGNAPVAQDTFTEMAWTPETIRNATGTYESAEGTTIKLYEKNGNIALSHNDTEKKIRVVGPSMLLIQNPFAESDMLLVQNREKGVFGIRLGGRIIPKKV